MACCSFESREIVGNNRSTKAHVGEDRVGNSEIPRPFAIHAAIESMFWKSDDAANLIEDVCESAVGYFKPLDICCPSQVGLDGLELED